MNHFTQSHRSMHSIAAYYRRHANRIEAPDALITSYSQPGMVDMDFAFVAATPAKSPYQKYTANKSCTSR
jgi:hypothetical protein